MQLDYKKTLNMPQTTFEMKADLKNKEPLIQKKWIEENLYEHILKKNKDGAPWILHDGPPYANGNIHVGHALNKILKDIIVRHKLLQGNYSPYIPGWDTHGLPIEHALLKNEPLLLKELSIADFRTRCMNFAQGHIDNQKIQFLRLGMVSDFKNVYKTFNKEFEADQINVFKKMVESGLVYKGLKPVYWSWSSQSALAEAEIEYAERKSPSIYVGFELTDGLEILPKGTNLLIWTTTPWTIPANLALAVHPDFDYVLVKSEDQTFVFAENLLEQIKVKLNLKECVILKKFKGKILENMKYQHSLYNKHCPVICADYVSKDDGTGLVQNAPGFGIEDYIACKKYNIDPFCPINDYGKYTSEVNDDELVNKFYEDANEIVINRIKANRKLFHSSILTHSVAHDWRTKKPVMYRATNQWFVNLENKKEDIINCLKDVKSHPEWAVERMKQMIKNRGEWCISRQRTWGVPITIIYDENDNPIFDSKVFEKIIGLVRQHGSNVWFDHDAKFFLPHGYDLKKEYRKETNIMDVWFDSGSSYTVLKENHLPERANMYLEGGDQFRGWFNSSLITSAIINNKAPYRELLTHGFVLDEKGNKMSKSLGNVIDPLKVCDEYGADVLRLWVATTDYSDDVRIGQTVLKNVSELYRKFRNSIFKFILGNLNDFDFKKDHQTKLAIEDEYILSQLHKQIAVIETHYEKYNYSLVIQSLTNLLTELSTWYFEVIKDSLYCDDAKSLRRKQIQTTLYHILDNFLIALSPILPHTTEEAYSHFNKMNKKDSIHLESWIDHKKIFSNEKLINIFRRFYEIKDAVYKKIEEERANKKIGKGIEAEVTITILLADKELFNSHFSWNTLLNVSVVHIDIGDRISVEVKAANGNKCNRCWVYYPKNQMHSDDLCLRCSNVHAVKNFAK